MQAVWHGPPEQIVLIKNSPSGLKHRVKQAVTGRPVTWKQVSSQEIIHPMSRINVIQTCSRGRTTSSWVYSWALRSNLWSFRRPAPFGRPSPGTRSRAALESPKEGLRFLQEEKRFYKRKKGPFQFPQIRIKLNKKDWALGEIVRFLQTKSYEEKLLTGTKMNWIKSSNVKVVLINWRSKRPLKRIIEKVRIFLNIHFFAWSNLV